MALSLSLSFQMRRRDRKARNARGASRPAKRESMGRGWHGRDGEERSAQKRGRRGPKACGRTGEPEGGTAKEEEEGERTVPVPRQTGRKAFEADYHNRAS